jgi:hypothetical protein
MNNPTQEYIYQHSLHSGENYVNIETGQFLSGTYTYSIVVDGMYISGGKFQVTK